MAHKTEADFSFMPTDMLLRAFVVAQQGIKEHENTIRLARSALIAKTGHGPNPENKGITCLCGYVTGGYPSDKQRNVGAHVLDEWEKAASGG